MLIDVLTSDVYNNCKIITRWIMFDKIMEQINSMDIFCDGILAIDLQGYICCCRSNPLLPGL